MRVVGIVLACIVVIALLFGLSFGTEHLNLWWQRHFAPKYEDVKRDVFESTRSYNQAKMQELAKYKLEYEMAQDSSAKAALANVIRHKFADYNDEKLPYGLQVFLKEVRGY